MSIFIIILKIQFKRFINEHLALEINKKEEVFDLSSITKNVF